MTEHSSTDINQAQVTYRSGRKSTVDGLDLHWQSWCPAEARGVVAIVHGLAEHSGRYRATAEALSNTGWAVCAIDLRAHGLSPDPPRTGRVHVNRFEDYFWDVDSLLEVAGELQPGLPVFILGHSMGGLISIRYALAKPGSLSGAIISSPALGTHPDFQPPRMLKLLVSILSILAPRFLVASDLDTTAISRDPEVVKAYLDDPLVSQKISARWYSEILKSIKVVHEKAGSLKIPMLLMQSGSDRLVDPDATRRWAGEAPDGLVDLVVWDGLYHEMLNEPEKARVLDRITGWLKERTAGR